MNALPDLEGTVLQEVLEQIVEMEGQSFMLKAVAYVDLLGKQRKDLQQGGPEWYHNTQLEGFVRGIVRLERFKYLEELVSSPAQQLPAAA